MDLITITSATFCVAVYQSTYGWKGESHIRCELKVSTLYRVVIVVARLRSTKAETNSELLLRKRSERKLNDVFISIMSKIKEREKIMDVIQCKSPWEKYS